MAKETSHPQLALEPRERIFGVTTLVRQARALLEGQFGSVWVQGEISNLARPGSGHWYFSLKDSNSQIRCAMFRQFNRRVSATPENGQEVVIRGRVSLYEARGEFQIVVEELEDAGDGKLKREFEALKRKLDEEGLFAADRKRSIPRLPRRIGVVTSPTGAAIRDVLTVLRRRFPSIGVLIYPTVVQGRDAGASVARALTLASNRGDCDVIILARGGGSLEDLWAFNEEVVARAVVGSRIPVIAGIGHEIDVTIADLAADLRAPTPSGAAELAAPERREWLEKNAVAARRLSRAIAHRLASPREMLAGLSTRLQRSHPRFQLGQLGQRVDRAETELLKALRRLLKANGDWSLELEQRLLRSNPASKISSCITTEAQLRQRLTRAMQNLFSARRGELDALERTLAAVSPTATLDRGYAIVRAQESGQVLTAADQVQPEDWVTIQLGRGELDATVRKVSCPD